MESSLPPLAVHQLHSAPAPPPGAPPARVSVWGHSLFSDHRMLAPLAQHYIDAAAVATGTSWTAVLPDMRCHGDSAGLALPPPNTVDALASDLARTLAAGQREGRCVAWDAVGRAGAGCRAR